MYPNQGPPNPYGGYPSQYPGAPPFGAGYPPQQPAFGSGYPQQQQPAFGSGYPQMPMPGMSQPGMPQPGMPMPQQGGYPGQQPPMGQMGYPPQQQQQPPQQPGGYQPYPQSSQPAYPQMPQGNFGMPPQQQQPDQMLQQQYSYQNASAYGAPPTQQHQQQMYSSPTYGQPLQQYQSSTQPKGRPTVVPAPNFNASNDAGALRKAMKGFGTDEDAIIEVLCRRSNAQRIDIVRTYKTAYGKDLLNDIRSETTGNFERVLIALLTPSTELYARELFEAMYGEGTDEDVLIEVMCTMSNREIREICATFGQMFGKSLEQELRSDTSGHFKRLMTSLSTGHRDESMTTDVNAARVDAEELKRAGIDKWGTDESVFNRILCLRNYEQIKLIAQEYEKLTGHPLEKDIKKEFSGDIEDGLLAILRVAHNRPEFFARRLHKTMAGLGTNDNSLIRLVVTRCEVDMMDVKEEFQRYYGKSLKSFIKGDTSGDYKHALYALIGENRS